MKNSIGDKGFELLNANNYQAAIQAFNKSLALQEHWHTYQGLGWALFNTNQHQAAIQAFNKSLALQEHWHTYLGLGAALIITNQNKAAIQAFNKSLALQEHWHTYQGLGWALANTNQHQAAIQAFNKSLALQEHWHTYQGLGWVLVNTNQHQAAIQAFNKSLALQEHWNTYLGLGAALIQTNQNQEAIQAFNKSLALQEHWDTYQGLGAALFQTNQSKAAIQAFNKSLALQEHWHTYQGLGAALIQTNQNQAAIQAYNKSLALQEHWQTYQGLGWALVNTNQHQAAIQAFNKSLALQEHWSTYQGLGAALIQTNQNQAACLSIYKWNYYQHSDAAMYLFYKSYIGHQPEETNDVLLKTLFTTPYGEDTDRSVTIFLEYIQNRIKRRYINPLLIRMVSTMLPYVTKMSMPTLEVDAIKRIKRLTNDINQNTQLFIGKRKIVFGVSHARIYEECSGFEVVNTGAGTMYNIGDPDSTTGHGNRILSRLTEIEPSSTCLIFEYGEVDLRNHILKQSERKGQSPYQLCNNTIERYFSFLESIKQKGFTIIVSAPHCGGGDWSHPSTHVERNDLCAYLNDKLAAESNRRGMFFYTLFDISVDQETLRNNEYFFQDHMHLYLPCNQSNNIGIALSNLASARANITLKNYSPMNRSIHKSEITANCRILVSNIPNWESGTEFTPQKLINGEEYLVDSQKYLSLIQFPFGMNLREVFLDFDSDCSLIKTSVQAVQELYDISKEYERDNILNSIMSCDPVENPKTLKHSFPENLRIDETSRFLIIKILSKFSGARLVSIRLTRCIVQ